MTTQFWALFFAAWAAWGFINFERGVAESAAYLDKKYGPDESHHELAEDMQRLRVALGLVAAVVLSIF